MPHNFLEELLDVLADWPINLHECGLQCANVDFLSWLFWAMNNYETLDCANKLINLLLGEC